LLGSTFQHYASLALYETDREMVAVGNATAAVHWFI